MIQAGKFLFLLDDWLHSRLFFGCLISLKTFEIQAVDGMNHGLNLNVFLAQSMNDQWFGQLTDELILLQIIF